MNGKKKNIKNSKKHMQEGRKLFSIPEVYGIYVKAFRGFRILKKGRKAGTVDEKLQERIMLAVTAVNKCAMCSYAHTEMALKAGLSNEEIMAFAGGEFPDMPAGEIKAVLFAQHYADVRGRLDEGSWNELTKEYGIEKAKCILAATRIIMMGNAMGIVFSSIRSRFKKEKNENGKHGDPRSSIAYEILFVLCLLPVMLAGSFQALIMNLCRIPFIKFRSGRKDAAA